MGFMFSMCVSWSWWCHQMEIFSPVNSPHKSQWRRDLMFSLICAWFEMPSHPLWRHCNDQNILFKQVSEILWNRAALENSTLQCLYKAVDFLQYPHKKAPHRSVHDDVIKWKHFPRNWPFVRGIHRSRWIPHTKASDAELWCFLWSASE